MEIVPGKKLGIYEIGTNLYEVIKTLDCDFKYEIRGSISVLSSKKIFFVFNEKKELKTVVTKSSIKEKFCGIGYNSKISKIVELFPDAAVDVEGALTIPNFPGIYFMFSNSDTDLLYESGTHDEGISDFVGDVKVKQIAIHKIEND